MGPGRGCFPGGMTSYNGRRDRNLSAFVSIVRPVFGTAGYRGVLRRVTGGRTERGAEINYGYIRDRGDVGKKVGWRGW